MIIWEIIFLVIKNIISLYSKKINYTVQNIFNFENSNKFNFITIGEVLEHVTKPQEILKKLKNIIAS